jgi:hypothetical protein
VSNAERAVRVAVGIALIGIIACSHNDREPGFLVGTPEVKRLFGLHQDTFPEAPFVGTGDVAVQTAKNALTSLGFKPESTCARAFRAESRFVVYVRGSCVGGRRTRLVADGDALVLVSERGDSSLQTLLAPGGIELHPDEQ